MRQAVTNRSDSMHSYHLGCKLIKVITLEGDKDQKHRRRDVLRVRD